MLEKVSLALQDTSLAAGKLNDRRSEACVGGEFYTEDESIVKGEHESLSSGKENAVSILWEICLVFTKVW